MHAGTLLGKLQQRSCRVAVVVCHELVCAEDEQPKHNGGVLDGNGNVQRGIARLRLRVDFSTCPQQVADDAEVPRCRRHVQRRHALCCAQRLVHKRAQLGRGAARREQLLDPCPVAAADCLVQLNGWWASTSPL